MADAGWTLEDRQSAAAAIRRLREEDLLYLNRLIVERLKLLSQARSTVLMSGFNIGDRVTFRNPYGELMTGVVFRLNKKTISVHTDDGHHWNVAPALLKQAGNVPEKR